jgi:pimeloyl-ACP methyl ester carboxylesterase
MQIHDSRFGQGPPIILVHGWGADTTRNWIDTGWVAALEGIRGVVAMDCRGHGRSQKPHAQEAYSYRSMSQDVLQVMNDLGIAKADLFGYSMGAFMAVSLLGHHRERFTSVIMGGIGDETEQSEALRFVIADALRTGDPDRITDARGRAYRAFVDTDPTNDLEALALSALQMWPEGHPLDLGGAVLREVGIPVLIVNGADDHPYVDTAGRLAAAVPGAKLVTIPDTDHVSVVSDPRFKVAVLDFLTGHDHPRTLVGPDPWS